MSIWSGYCIDDEEYVKEVLGDHYGTVTKDKDIKWNFCSGDGPPVSILDCDFNIFLQAVIDKLIEMDNRNG
ncbi:hypothetical protein LCGC14_2731020 [marine sediment metagenome]|uniref:Uncharacterized protein n=1 Tax=marine sediment metagenome TaxID=412755 RepID=A0A0F9BGA1_9ZZZZ